MNIERKNGWVINEKGHLGVLKNKDGFVTIMKKGSGGDQYLSVFLPDLIELLEEVSE